MTGRPAVMHRNYNDLLIVRGMFIYMAFSIKRVSFS